MDTSFLAAGPITWVQVFAFAFFLVTLLKGSDWIVGKMRAGTKDAVSPLTIDMAAAKIEIRQIDEKLSAFKIEVARTYVTGDVITRLERRIDDLVSSVRDEMKETRDIMLKALTGRPPS
ncbi:DUF2730 domain-containing protein [Methylorubrum populi]